jgi:hypothetical protein
LESSGRKNRNLGIIIVAIICLLIYLVPTPKEIDELESAPPTPYTVHKSVLKKSSGYVYDYAKVVGHKIPFRKGNNTPLSNSRPHPVQTFPDFQEKMYKLTAEDWDSYERKLVEFSKRALPKQMAKWAVGMLKDRSPRRQAMRAQAGQHIPDIVWQTGKDLPTVRNSFQDKNPRAIYNFYDDNLLENWAKQHFLGSLVKRTWDGMERVVLKADFWRYLVTYLEGGFYSGECAPVLHRRSDSS